MTTLQAAQIAFRNEMVARLRSDLLGPSAPNESIADRPSDRYLTGILYPAATNFSPEEDEGLETAETEADEAALDPGVALVSTQKPGSAGLSFALKPGPDSRTVLTVRISCGTYRAALDGSNGGGGNRPARRWQREPHEIEFPDLEIPMGHRAIDLKLHGLEGLELYFQAALRPGGTVTVTAALVNRNERGATRNETEERSFFQVELVIEASNGCVLVERPVRRAAMDDDARVSALIYRNARELAAGHTCAADWEIADDAVLRVRTTWLPISKVEGTREEGEEVFADLRAAGFFSAEWLEKASASELVKAMGGLVTAYEHWLDEEQARVATIPERLRPQALINLNECRRGAARMREGVAMLENDKKCRRAFQLAQKAMFMQRRWSTGEDKLEWRPFQLGFQLLTLSSLAKRGHEDREVMDLLWFPTGGGKTEAYLALTAFVLFHRRLRATANDDGSGTAVIMRYTLRLLTVQQFQRATAMVTACELIRSRERDLGKVKLSIGLWVGNSATPAKLADARNASDSRSTHRQLADCPACHGDLEWKLPNSGMEVRCKGKACELAAINGRIPVWTIDEDIYREQPSLLIGTVDKFAQIVRKEDTLELFGRGATRHHPPDLIIQDELHLISGPLGSLAGLYETAIDELCSEGGHRPKIIGSTATIRRAAEQVRQLFRRKAYQFPPAALDARSSCFAVSAPEKPGRLYIGVTTAGRSAKYTVQAVAASLLQAAHRQSVPAKVRDPYWTLVGYFNSLRELGGSLVLMQDDVPITIGQLADRNGDPSPREIQPPAELTSRIGSSEVRDMLDELHRGCGDDGAFDVLLASNMISVGVDIPRLGLMMMVGQPKTISEYIQATSRVGRGNVPGLVVSLYNAGRARDRAHFETFRSWHSMLYREVEATSVTPFAPRAQDKALHAVMVTLARHLIGALRSKPTLAPALRPQLDDIAAKIVARAEYVDAAEAASVSAQLRLLLDEWENAAGLESYWDDYGKKRSLLISAEQAAAGGSPEDDDVDKPWLWPTPNSMREVEPSTNYVLVSGLKAEEVGDGA